MLPRPQPWLVWRLWALWQKTGTVRQWLLSHAARLRFGELVVDADALQSRFVEVASTPMLGEPLLLAIITANVEAHGMEAVDAAVGRALDTLAAPGSAASVALAGALAAFQQRTGGILRPLELLESGLGGAAGVDSPPRLRTLRQQAQLLRSGVRYGGPVRRGWEPAPGRVLYYANQTLPHHLSGYAIRTHWLARTLRDKGWELSVYARLGYPNDRFDFIGVRTADGAADIDGVPYRFTPEGRMGRSIADYQTASVDALLGHCAQLRPSILHAATNYTGGLAGTEAAKRLSIPSVYEVRGLWHMTKGATQPEYLDSDHYRMIERLEVQGALQADHVFTITEAVGDVLIQGGVSAEKITVLPNAVEPTTFAPRERERRLEQGLGLRGKVTLGYIGAFKEYEGLDYLLQAAALLRRRVGDRFAVLLVGDGNDADALKALAARLDLARTVIFTGRVPHAVTPDLYTLCDIIAFPRKGYRVCEVVSPIKPFEAMASGKAVVVSDVRALTEIVQHEKTGLVHRADDVHSLAEQLERLIRDPALRRELAQAGHDWVVEHRTWSRVCDEVDRVYRRLLNP